MSRSIIPFYPSCWYVLRNILSVCGAWLRVSPTVVDLDSIMAPLVRSIVFRESAKPARLLKRGSSLRFHAFCVLNKAAQTG